MPHFAFNKELWEAGRKIEDAALPQLNKYFKTDFKRNENDIFDILDFKNIEDKIIVEVKGRRNSSDAYEDTIITASKVMAGHQAIDEGYRVYFLFVFSDCSKIMELKEDSSFKVKYTGSNCIQHYMIPVADLDDFVPFRARSGSDDEFEPEPEEEEYEKIN
tara:strand:- start:846 stop:1328 length:483 start_codon:yes stop_codon:yes gene_type:complete